MLFSNPRRRLPSVTSQPDLSSGAKGCGSAENLPNDTRRSPPKTGFQHRTKHHPREQPVAPFPAPIDRRNYSATGRVNANTPTEVARSLRGYWGQEQARPAVSFAFGAKDRNVSYALVAQFSAQIAVKTARVTSLIRDPPPPTRDGSRVSG